MTIINSSIKHIAILGSTGSIGTQALDIISQHASDFKVEVLTAHSNATLLIEQAIAYRPSHVVIGKKELYDEVKKALAVYNIVVMAGAEAICEVVALPSVNTVLTAMVGYAGLQPTIAAIQAGKNIALANKETLVVAGELITDLAAKNAVKILPVDSEHSAIFQCLTGEDYSEIEKIILTASGGPFRGKDHTFLQTVTKAQALKHPNWTMGAKITIDSASLMNKGLEVIEAKWLFGLKSEQIEVVVHPQSIVHSLVQMQDGSIKAQMGLPDMKLPIIYAFSYPNRVKTMLPRFDFAQYPQLSFEQPDINTFRNLGLAYEAMKKGGNMPCILNAANEIAVQTFLEDKIGFLQMSDMVESCMAKATFVAKPCLQDYIDTDREARELAKIF